MGHRRTKMGLIENYKTRMLTFRKRKKNLLKKAEEFSILCNVSACVVVFPPNGSDKLSKAESWPSNPDDVVSIIKRYKMSDLPRKNYHVSDYFAEKIRKVDAELAKLRKQVSKARHPSWDNGLDDLSKDQLMTFLARLEVKLEVVDQKLGMMKENIYMVDRIGCHVGENFSYGLEHMAKAGSSNVHAGDLQLIPNFNQLEVQSSGNRLQQGDHSSQMSLFNQNLPEIGENSSIGYSPNLQVFADPRPLDFPPLVGFQQKHEFPTKMLENQGGNDISIGFSDSQFETLPGLSHTHNSGSWMWDHVLSTGRPISSMNYVSTIMQPFQSTHQNFPLLGYTCPEQSSSSQPTGKCWH